MGFEYILNNINLRKVLQGIVLANLTLGIIYVSEVIFFKDVLNIMPNVYGEFLAAAGIGIISFALNTNMYFVVILLIIEGIGEALFTVTSVTIIQQNTDDSNRSGILTFNDSLSKSAYILSMGAAWFINRSNWCKIYTISVRNHFSFIHYSLFKK